ncbi:hypothetical protein SAMN04488515_1288 [Cognatiyoonia koreensis]|uniref:DUF2087 domain-containing protein n=1 Tax=Cognatiyoonia koreensis TaxID=364200 RepID=A0A1I0PLA6_9RHOB|nr:DUF2087 domain-containing protein [Cognatiyoonia koreensis]SEW14995.1 hypothetical protein SAMN04488515_1288 [Cognatiyoonia koreensis]
MPRSQIPLVIEDASAFARNLRQDWPREPLGQAEMLARIAKAAGYRNHQHLKAETPEEQPLDKDAQKRITDALRVFSNDAIMVRWPQKTSVQRLCLMWFWSRIPGRIDLTENQVNDILRAGERFGDHVLLRRSLIDQKLVKRSIDGSVYRRIEQRPRPEERQFLRNLSERCLLRV